MTVTINIAEHDCERMLNALASFCRIHGAPHCYQNWSPETLRDFLQFHLRQKTLVCATHPLHERVVKLTATGVAWQCNESEIRAAHAEGRMLFNWQPTDPAGDSVYFSHFICLLRTDMPRLVQKLSTNHPRWKTLKLFRHRWDKQTGRPVLEQMSTQTLNRLLERKCYG